MTQNFRDLYSALAADYVQYRPQYPSALFSWLSTQVGERHLAWDCACGSGQSALGLTPYFDTIVATDASAEQLAKAGAHPKIEYRNELAQASSLQDKSVDLVTIAAALHWFAGKDFYDEVKRVLKPNGVIAAWSYGPPMAFTDDAMNECFQTFYRKTLAPLLPQEVHHIFQNYKSLPFPFKEVEPPALSINLSWSMGDMMGYLRTWSATKKYMETHGVNPLIQLEEQARPFWLDPQKPKQVLFNLKAFRVGRMAQ